MTSNKSTPNGIPIRNGWFIINGKTVPKYQWQEIQKAIKEFPEFFKGVKHVKNLKIV